MTADCNKFWHIVPFLALSLSLTAQKDNPIVLINPSFEGIPNAGAIPAGWTNCGPATETPPDTQPGSFDVGKPASHGNSYLGLVVRDNETWESVSQRLSRPLEVNQCYEFTIDVCKSEIYKSQSKTTNQPANYVTPARLLIWGGTGACGKVELLYETSIIQNTRWLTVNVRLHPKKGNYNYIVFEAYYKTPVLFPYNGNVMLDNATPIRTITCNPEKMPDMVQKDVTKNQGTTRNGTNTKGGTTTAQETTKTKLPDPAAAEPTVTYKGTKLRKGSIVRLDKVYFEANKVEIKQECEPALSEILTFLLNNRDVVIEIGGHTNNLPSEQYANTLSNSRAKSVADWLIAKGVSPNQIQFKGYGKTMPIEPNTTADGRRKNQRVEIKVLNING
jgi:outer membrane protein OmpA-like peptidoglycan-associated protein